MNDQLKLGQDRCCKLGCERPCAVAYPGSGIPSPISLPFCEEHMKDDKLVAAWNED